MKNIAEQAEWVMIGLDKSQDELEEMAFELLNAVDHVKKHNEEMRELVDLILEMDSGEVKESAIQDLRMTLVKISRAMDGLEKYVHKNEEASSEHRKYIEEAKQVVDFLRCFLDVESRDNDRLL